MHIIIIQIATFLNSFCASATPKTYTSAVTDRVLTTCTPMVNPQKTDSVIKMDMGTPVAVLGALAGLLTVVLALVVGGWVCTCWSIKKRSDRTQLYTKCQVNATSNINHYRCNLIIKCKDCEEKRSYPNPTYGMTTESQPASGTDTQVHSQEEGNGQMHNTINTDDNQGKTR